MKSFIAIGVVSAFLTATAVAETPEERHACTSDAFRVCWVAIPDRDSVVACMAKNKSKLGPACRAVMAHYDALKRTHGSRRIVESENADALSN